MQSIYWQIHHVYHNINFSRIAVRNNHAITETLMLYASDKLFPFLPDVHKWAKRGKKWLEKELLYQIYEDGTYLQFSMNYHRVVIQLLTYAFTLADLNNDKFKEETYSRAYKSVDFLFQCSQQENGFLPNYGANDGALFFKLTNSDYRDFRPQLNTLHYLLTGKDLFSLSEIKEERYWFTSLITGKNNFRQLSHIQGVIEYPIGGYYLIRDEDTLTFIRCGNHKDRPSQADNLHVDIWVKGENILGDSGSYKYNTNIEELNSFMGTKAHNTVSLGGNSQMFKGGRFIWYYWTQKERTFLEIKENKFIFEGRIKAFTYLDKNIKHERIIEKVKGKLEWVIQDRFINNTTNLSLLQYWHGSCYFHENFDLSAKDDDGIVPISYRQSWRSNYYGLKEEMKLGVFETKTNRIITKIVSNSNKVI